jgi:hypothetical protein
VLAGGDNDIPRIQGIAECTWACTQRKTFVLRQGRGRCWMCVGLHRLLRVASLALLLCLNRGVDHLVAHDR